MPQEIHVVQLSVDEELYLSGYDTDPQGNPTGLSWSSLEEAITFETRQAADNMATSIGGGTVGTTKPN